MKKAIIIATTSVAAVLAIFYIIKRIKKPNSIPANDPSPRSHHLTDVFSHAKQPAESGIML